MITTNQEFEFEKNGFNLETLVTSYFMSLLLFHLEYDAWQQAKIVKNISTLGINQDLGQHTFTSQKAWNLKPSRNFYLFIYFYFFINKGQEFQDMFENFLIIFYIYIIIFKISENN